MSDSATAREQLHAFEDEHLKNPARNKDGHVERGSGSMFQRMGEDWRARHAVLEKMVAAEDKVAAANADLAAAQAAHDTALAELAALDDKAAEAKPVDEPANEAH